MTKRTADTSIILWGDRHLPGHMIMDQARAMEASGVVDWASFPDHMVNFIPPSLWTPENTPMATVLGDPDSLQDATIMGTLTHVAAPKLKLSFASDSVRKGPAELCQLMWSMASVTEGRARFQFGPGEVKQCKPYGHNRAQGLARLEDLLKISKALWESDGPIDHVGNHWEMKQAYLGGAKPYRPEIWTMGSGPKQVDLTTTYCDGISASAPIVWTDAAHARTEIEKIKQMLVEKGRDPDAFGFGAFCTVIAHEDAELVNRALDNPIIRWLSAIVGRVNPAEWRKEGIEPATPEGWAYFMKFLPYETSPEFVQEVIAKTTRKMAEKSYFYGNSAQVAAQLQEYVDAGVTWICIVDYTAMVLEPADAAMSLGRMIDICARLKGTTATAAATTT